MKLIKLYQKYLSPDHSFWAKDVFPDGYCRFYPTCSSYTHKSIDRFGSIKGSWMGFLRVLRCNPWNPGGLDPVPEKPQKEKHHKKPTKQQDKQDEKLVKKE